jgi:hypothetical protein
VRHGWNLARSLVFLSFSVVGWTCIGHASEPLDDRLGTRTAPIILLTRHDIQADLGLSPQQISEANQAGAEIYWKAFRLRGNRSASAVQARRSIDEEATLWLTTNLTDQQHRRLHEIEIQWEGVAAMLNRPMVTEYLRLTAEQRRSLTQILAARYDPRRSQLPWLPADHENLSRKAVAQLTDVQKQLWNQLLGPPIRFSVNARDQANHDRLNGSASVPGSERAASRNLKSQ